MFVCCECCVLSGRGLCDDLITRPEKSYRLWCVVMCDLEISRMSRRATGKRKRSVTEIVACNWALGAGDMILAESGRQYSVQNLFLYQFVNHQSYMDWPRIRHGHPLWEFRQHQSMVCFIAVMEVLLTGIVHWISRKKYGFS
jgi:hypothetical protein